MSPLVNSYEEWFVATRETVLNLMISKIEICDDTIVISTSRPGLLIGKKGETINQLISFLKQKVKIIEVESINDHLLGFMYLQELDNY